MVVPIINECRKGFQVMGYSRTDSDVSHYYRSANCYLISLLFLQLLSIYPFHSGLLRHATPIIQLTKLNLGFPEMKYYIL